MNVLSVFWGKEIKTGAHKRLIRLLRGLAERGHEVNLITKKGFEFDHGKVQPIEVESGSLPSNKIDAVWNLLGHPWKTRRIERADVIVCFGLGSVVPGIYLKHITETSLLFSLRAYPKTNILRDSLVKQFIYRAVSSVYLKVSLHEANKIVVQVECHRDVLVNNHGVGRGRVEVVPNNILNEKEEVVTEGGTVRAEKILFVGTLNRRKGIDILLKAFSRVSQLERGIQLHVAGEGPMKKWAESYVRREGLEEDVVFHGFVENVRCLMKRCDLVVIPSRKETFPNVALEAMSVGTPFIASDLKELRSAFGNATEYVQIDSPGNLAAAIASLSNKERYINLRESCLSNRDSFVFDWVGRFECLLKEVK